MKYRPITIVPALVILLSTLVIAGCGGAQAPAPAAEPQAQAPSEATELSAGPTSGGTLVVAKSIDPPSLDPQRDAGGPSAEVQDNIFEPLVAFDYEMELQPRLAVDWTVSEDGTEYTFELREDVKFHDGSDFNAEAVKFVFDRSMAKIGDKQNRYLGLISPLQSVEVVDDYTVKFILENPHAPFLNTLAHMGFAMISPTAVEEYGEEFGTHPVGTGPFELVDWKDGESITLERNPDYWREDVPLLDTVEYRIIPDEATQLVALESGQVDMILNVPEHEVPRLEATPGVDVYVIPSLRTVFLMFSPKNAPFDDMAVRQAIAHAVDQQEIAETLLEGLHRPADHATFAPRVWGVTDEVPGYETDVERAQAILEEAGWTVNDSGIRVKDGQPLEFTLWTPSNRYPKDTQIAEYLAGVFEDLGMQVSVQTAEWGAYRDMIFNRELGMFLFGAGVSTGDVDYVAYLLFHSSQRYAQTEFVQDWGEIDSMLDEARAETDREQRLQLYNDIFTEIRDQYIWIPIYWQSVVIAANETVEGFQPHAMESLFFENTWIEESN